MLFTRDSDLTEKEIMNKSLIKELIEFERYCRDYGYFEEMERCFDQNSVVNISWFQGSGFDFFEASRYMDRFAPHKINNILVWCNGEHAVAECITSIQIRVEIDDALLDLTSNVKLHYK
ncbi:MAG: hypothetical protein ACOWWH_13475 [Eubacteriaceae bacterium]